MGTIKNEYGANLCDICSKPPATMYGCPFGYCPPVLLCGACAEAQKENLSRANHVKTGCEKRSAEYRAMDIEREEMMKAGIPIRVSAMGVGNGRVHVIFKSCNGAIGYYMPNKAYDAIPLGVVSTPDHYRKFGTLEAAPNYFYG